MEPSADEDAVERRRTMVARQIESRGTFGPRVLDAMRRVPREAFLPAELSGSAYEDGPLPIECGQTISQPYMVALMVDALELSGGEKVLEVGTGSGYAAAVLAEIAGEVLSIERHALLARRSAARLARLGYDNVRVLRGDGSLGHAAEAPFDAIVVAACATEIPESLRAQLAIGGRLVLPVGPRDGAQVLERVVRVGPERFERRPLADVRFVPLLAGEA